MAPALIEAAASVSQNPKRKFDFIQTDLLEGLTSDFAKEQGIATTSGRTSETKPNSGQLVTQVADTSEDSRVLNKKNFIKSGLKYSIEMEELSQLCKNTDTGKLIPSESGNVEESLEAKLGLPSETCARSEVEGGKSQNIRSQPLAESTPYITLKERTNKSNTKLQSLDRRARCLKTRVRNFQTNRLLSHIKTQAQLLDYSNKTTNDPLLKGELKLTDSPSIIEDKDKSHVQNGANSESPTTIASASPSIASLLRNDTSKMGTTVSHTVQGPGANFIIKEKGDQIRGVGNAKKKDVFGVLTNSVKEIMIIDDPDVTDSESDEDDNIHVPFGKNERASVRKRKNVYDETWAKDRVQIGSMCTWIQAQIADLSHKIKRYGDLHHHIKTNRKQLALEETRKQPISNGNKPKQAEDSLLSKDDVGTDSLQSNIFARLQAHKNGLAKEFCQETELKYEKGSGARTIPAAKFPQHKYVKRSIETAFKGNSVSYQCKNLPAPFPCAQCIKATTTGFGRTTANLAAVTLDHSYHEQLSTKYDVSLPLILESTLRKEKLCYEKKNLLPAASAKRALAEKKDIGVKGMRENAAASSRAAKNAKLRMEKKRLRRPLKAADEESEKEESPVPKKKAPNPTAASLLQRRANSLRAPSSGSGESRPSTPVTDQSFLSASCPAPTLSQLVKRKNRTSSEYDINNIVIPYSISSSTRLEKPQYKEILTPGWRPIDDMLDDPLKSCPQEWEDTRDDVYALRHSKYEVTEHHKFTAYFQVPFKRSRSVRKSSECNTPEPYSPSHPDTPCSAHTPTDFVLATPSSGSKVNKHSNWTLVLNVDDNKVLPWPSRTFPLRGEDLAYLDDEHQPIPVTCTEDPVSKEECKDIDITEEKVPEETPTPSSHSSDNEVVTPPPEVLDPDEEDEKWTVRLVTDAKPSPAESGTIRKGIVLKLAKK